MRDFARNFYLSTIWRRMRNYVFRRDMGLCVRCGAPGKIVHHKKHLMPENINDPSITLAEDNLELLCMECHAIEHGEVPPTAAGLMFDENGNLIERETGYEKV